MTAKQLSKRGGEIGCVNNGKRVIVSGYAVTYLEKNIVINQHI